jgi:hypothetical protein
VLGAAIVIEIAAADAASPHAKALVDACNHGPYAALTCSLAAETETDPPVALAVVNWDDPEHLSVTVQVGVRRQDGADWSVRQVRFVESDAERERWRTVGLVIATLVGQASAPTAVEPEAAKPAPPIAEPSKAKQPTSESALPARASFEPATWWLGGEVGLSRGAAGSASAVGAGLRLDRRIAASPFFAEALFRFETQQPNPDVTLRWLRAGLGAGATLQLVSRLCLEARFDVTWTSLSATAASDEVLGASSGALWSAHGGLGLGWWWSRWIALSVLGELSQSSRRSVVRLSGETTGSQPLTTIERLGWSVWAGPRLGF